MASERVGRGRPDETRAVLDTSVLFPAVLRDTLLRLAAKRLYLPVWSESILGELQRTLVREQRASSASAAWLLARMRAAFPDATTSLGAVMAGVSLPDPDDEHVLQAALGAGAHLVVTANARHFPERMLAPLGLRVATPDTFLLSLQASYADRIVETIREQAADVRRPSATPNDIVLRFRNHAPDFATWLNTALLESNEGEPLPLDVAARAGVLPSRLPTDFRHSYSIRVRG